MRCYLLTSYAFKAVLPLRDIYFIVIFTVASLGDWLSHAVLSDNLVCEAVLPLREVYFVLESQESQFVFRGIIGYHRISKQINKSGCCCCRILFFILTSHPLNLSGPESRFFVFADGSTFRFCTAALEREFRDFA